MPPPRTTSSRLYTWGAVVFIPKGDYSRTPRFRPYDVGCLDRCTGRVWSVATAAITKSLFTRHLCQDGEVSCRTSVFLRPFPPLVARSQFRRSEVRAELGFFHSRGACEQRRLCASANVDVSPPSCSMPAKAADEQCCIKEAEEQMKSAYGPHAKLILRRLPQQRASAAEDGGEVEATKRVSCLQEGSASPETIHPITDQGASFYYRASATFLLLGFPVELAAVTGRNAIRTVDQCLQQALQSGVEFISPSTVPRRHRQESGNSQRQRHRDSPIPPHQEELRGALGELRRACVHFSRHIKFAVKPPPPGSSPRSSTVDHTSVATHVEPMPVCTPDRTMWRCRAYVKDDWCGAPRTVCALEVCGNDANEAITSCIMTLRNEYVAELQSPAVLMESVREVAMMVESENKTVFSHCEEETLDGSVGGTDNFKAHRNINKSARNEIASTEDNSPPFATEGEHGGSYSHTFVGRVSIEDGNGNVSLTQLRRQPSAFAAYQNASWQAIRTEYMFHDDIALLDERLPAVPLLLRLRWQFDAMVARISLALGSDVSEVAEVRVTDDTNPSSTRIKVTDQAAYGEYRGPSSVPHLFTATLLSEGSVVWQSTSPGRYRVEFDCYVQALQYLLDQYEDAVSGLSLDNEGGGILFPSSQLLSLAVDLHDRYRILSNHKGKWNCYALLGTLTSQLMGCFYQTKYSFDSASSEWRATLTYNDGIRTDQVLIQRSSKMKGEAWRMACLDALRENFPRQYNDVVQKHPDVDLSGDTMARGSKYRALPREKRIQHMGHLFALVQAFAEEDLGWQQLRIRLRNVAGGLGLAQWIAELEAQVEGEEERRVVAVSAPYTQVKHARRVLVYRVAQQFFSKELAIYAALNRADAVDPEKDSQARRTMLYKVGTTSFESQLRALLEHKKPEIAPLSWSLESFTANGVNDEALDESDADVIVGDVDLLENPLQLLKPFRSRFRAQVMGNGGDLLLAEHIGGAGETAVGVLVSALRAASLHIAGQDAETLWAEFESHTAPPVTTHRELCTYVFNAFFGVVGAISELTADGRPAIDVQAAALGDYWFTTATLSSCGDLPIARAVGTTKRRSIKDALMLATRQSFPRLMYFLMKNDIGASAIASDIMTEPIVEEVPEGVARDLRAEAYQQRSLRPPRPLLLLTRCVYRDYQRSRRLRVQQMERANGEFECHIFMQHNLRLAKKGETQLVGQGRGHSRCLALHGAAIAALENLFEEDLKLAERSAPGYRLHTFTSTTG